MGIFCLPEGNTVAKLMIAIPIIFNSPESFLTTYNPFRPLGKAVAKFVIATPVPLQFSESLLTIHGV